MIKMKFLSKNKLRFSIGLLAFVLVSHSVYAKVGNDEAAKLGKELTPMGSEKAGNADGSIPPWTGGITEKPACFDGSTFLCNPYAEDKPQFVITAENKEQYKDRLPAGLLAMLKRYPATFKIPVYQTRRSASYPDNIYGIMLKNATNTELLEGGNGLKNYQPFGVPFPIPKEPLELVWNHMVRYRGNGVYRITGQVAPQPNGSFTVVLFHDQVAFRGGLTDEEPGEDDNVLFYFKQQVIEPSRLAGNVLLVHETLDQVKEPRKAWVYNSGQRRVRRAPQVAYDGPGAASDGLRCADNFDMYNGAPDRYDWALLGKKEMYIPYNSYKLDEKGLKYTEIVKAGHLNPEVTRYELHRVWIVEATLKPGTRHIYTRRTFYIDEDTWQIGVADHYDSRGTLWRVSQAYAMHFYNRRVPAYSLEVVYDLNAGRYVAIGLENEEDSGPVAKQFSKTDFSPNSLRLEGVR